MLIISTGFSLAQNCQQCPSLWTRYQNNCYRFFGKVSSWFYAEDHCLTFTSPNSKKSGHLVSVHSAYENQFIFTLWNTSLLSELDWKDYYGAFNRANAVWMGLNDYQRKPFDFVWTDGTYYNNMTSYSNWLPGEPNDQNGTEWCVHMWNTINSDEYSRKFPDKWNDGSCDRPLPFICKLSLDD